MTLIDPTHKSLRLFASFLLALMLFLVQPTVLLADDNTPTPTSTPSGVAIDQW